MASAESTRGTRNSSTTVRAGSAVSPSMAAAAAFTPISVEPATRLAPMTRQASRTRSANRIDAFYVTPALFGRGAPGKTGTMSDWIDAEGYRANIGILLMRDNGEVFLGRRTGGRGWQFPQGGVRQGEPIEKAMFRELQGEIGLMREAVRMAATAASLTPHRFA